MKLESDKRVVCDGSCSECVQCLRLYLYFHDVQFGAVGLVGERVLCVRGVYGRA